MDWRLHWLEAEGDLAPWRDRIVADAQDAWDAVSRVVPSPPIDILVQRLPGAVIPEIGLGGHAYRKGLLALCGDNQDGCRIASPELLPGSDLLPHVICSVAVCDGGCGDEAGEHGDA